MSPENAHHSRASIAAGTTMVNQLIHDVFSNTISASALLRTEKSYADSLAVTMPLLAACKSVSGDNYRNGCTTGTGKTTNTAMSHISTDIIPPIRFLLTGHRNFFRLLKLPCLPVVTNRRRYKESLLVKEP